MCVNLMRSFTTRPVPQYEPQKMYLKPTVTPYDLFPKTSEKYTKTKLRGRDSNLMTKLQEHRTQTLLKQHSEIEMAVKRYRDDPGSPTESTRTPSDAGEYSKRGFKPGGLDFEFTPWNENYDYEENNDPKTPMSPKKKHKNSHFENMKVDPNEKTSPTSGPSVNMPGGYPDAKMTRDVQTQAEDLDTLDNYLKMSYQQSLTSSELSNYKRLYATVVKKLGELVEANVYMQGEKYKQDANTQHLLHTILKSFGVQTDPGIKISFERVYDDLKEVSDTMLIEMHTREISQLNKLIHSLKFTTLNSTSAPPIHSYTQSQTAKPPPIETEYYRDSSSEGSSAKGPDSAQSYEAPMSGTDDPGYETINDAFASLGQSSDGAQNEPVDIADESIYGVAPERQVPGRKPTMSNANSYNSYTVGDVQPTVQPVDNPVVQPPVQPVVSPERTEAQQAALKAKFQKQQDDLNERKAQTAANIAARDEAKKKADAEAKKAAAAAKKAAAAAKKKAEATQNADNNNLRRSTRAASQKAKKLNTAVFREEDKTDKNGKGLTP